jgi:hypothetical protein
LRQELQQAGNLGADKLKQGADEVEKHAKRIGEHSKELTKEISAAVRELGRFTSGVTGLPLTEFRTFFSRLP